MPIREGVVVARVIPDPKVRWPRRDRLGTAGTTNETTTMSGLTRCVVPSPAIRRRSVMLALVAALAVVLGGRASAVAAQSSQTQSVSGTLSVVEGDPLGGGPHRVKTYGVAA